VSEAWGRVLAAWSFVRARGLAKRLETRADVEAWREARVARFLERVAPKVAAYRDVRAKTLSDLPMMDKAALMGAFERYNRAGVTADEARAAFAGSGRIGKLSVGASTGTSGNRGFYLISDRERFTWLGVMLAKALPDVTRTRHRVAIVLPANSRLYDAANESGRLALKFFDLRAGIDAVLPEVARFAPTAIVAPPKVLVELARADLPLAPRKLFSAAEVLDPLDRGVIEARFGVTLGQIYMATEGLFAVSCEQGGLHLCEDYVAFEWERTDGDLVAPIVTDFTRTTQVMARYRMNDLLRLDHRSCACGSPLQLVAEVAGRLDDIFHLPRKDGAGTMMVTPDVLRNAVVGADAHVTDFRIVQTEPGHVEVKLPVEMAGSVPAVTGSLHRLFDRLGVDAEVAGQAERLTPSSDRKLRRVQRLV
jgi:putative adenylate-forming enzyme